MDVPTKKLQGGIKTSKRKAHYTVRVAIRLCEHIALGDTLKEALVKEPLGPSMQVFWRWLDEYPDFRERYERARQMQADIHADRILEISKEVVAQPSKAGAYKVAADILRWQAEIRDPKKYGAKVQHELKVPLKPDAVKAEIDRLERELGVSMDKVEIVQPAELPIEHKAMDAPEQLQ